MMLLMAFLVPAGKVAMAHGFVYGFCHCLTETQIATIKGWVRK